MRRARGMTSGGTAGPARVVWHSAGANVALLVALRRPDLVERAALISGVFPATGGSRTRSTRA
jgi:pimeloyl-ACP methyl ester carboxylesterase